MQLFLRDLAKEVESVAYDIRAKTLEDRYRFGDELLHKMVVGESHG